MRYLPFDSFTIYSGRSYDEVHQLLEREVAQRDTIKIQGQQEPAFRGKVEEGYFRITRKIRYQNSFLPVITGKIEDNYPGSVIHIKMRAAISVYLFMVIWFTGVGFGLFFTLREMLPIAVIPLGMLLLGYSLMLFGYKFEARKARRILEGLLGDIATVSEPLTNLEEAVEKLVKKGEELQRP